MTLHFDRENILTDVQHETIFKYRTSQASFSFTGGLFKPPNNIFFPKILCEKSRLLPSIEWDSNSRTLIYESSSLTTGPVKTFLNSPTCQLQFLAR